jgi:hypothetical protein
VPLTIARTRRSVSLSIAATSSATTVLEIAASSSPCSFVESFGNFEGLPRGDVAGLYRN